MSVYEPHFWGDLWYEVFPEDKPLEEDLGLVEQPPHDQAQHQGLDGEQDR